MSLYVRTSARYFSSSMCPLLFSNLCPQNLLYQHSCNDSTHFYCCCMIFIINSCDFLYCAPIPVSTVFQFLSLLCSNSCLYCVPIPVFTVLQFLSLLCSNSCLYCAPIPVSTVFQFLSLLCSNSCLHCVLIPPLIC